MLGDERIHDADIRDLRQLHSEIDRAVLGLYGWSDLSCANGQQLTEFGLRWALDERTRAELVDRLLELNHARYADEVARGLHVRRRGRGRRRRTPSGGDGVMTLEFDGV